MKIILFGSSGQLGSSIVNLLNDHHEIITDKIDNSKVNLNSNSEVTLFLEKYDADLYINAAAYTDVDKAEIENQKCNQVNFEFVEQLSLFLKKKKKPLIHFSSDYVYGEKKDGLLIEDDALNPVNFYGLTKKNAEKVIIQNLNHFLIFRISWLYSNVRKNFYKTIKQLLISNKKVNVINDQWGSPTSSYFIAKIIKIIINKKLILNNFSGIYNLAPQNFTSWYGFAKEILRYNFNNARDIQILPISSDQYDSIAIRQKNSKLNCEKFKKTFMIKLEDWKEVYLEYEKKSFNK